MNHEDIKALNETLIQVANRITETNKSALAHSKALQSAERALNTVSHSIDGQKRLSDALAASQRNLDAAISRLAETTQKQKKRLTLLKKAKRSLIIALCICISVFALAATGLLGIVVGGKLSLSPISEDGARYCFKQVRKPSN